MQVECHTARILEKSSASKGELLHGVVLVEFTLRDEDAEGEGPHDYLVERVSVQTKPTMSEQAVDERLTQTAFDQVIGYYEESKAATAAYTAAEKPGESNLTAEQEAELEAELRSIELEFEGA